MDVTPVKPQTSETSRGSRHTPTPQMSERKRALFGRHNTANLCLTVDEDSDLGPMSPIRYSPVEEVEDGPRYTFQNILLMEPATPEMDEASNMSSVISDQTSKVPDPISMETNMETEKENHTEEDMKTPEVGKQNYCKDLRISFKKSLILGDISLPQSLAGTRKWLAKWQSDSDEESEKKTPKQDDGEPLRAKTSLTFEPPTISPHCFYTPDVGRTKRRAVFAKKPATTGRRYMRGAKKIGLINKGVGHKICKPKLRDLYKAVEKPKKQEVAKKQGNPEISPQKIERVNAILKSARNPIEMARPLSAKVDTSDEEEIEEDVETDEVEVKPGKFFKSGTKRAKKYQLTNTLSATVNGGKMTIVPLKKRKVRLETFGEEQQDAFLEEHNEIEGIINQLTVEEEEEIDGIIAKVGGDPYEEFRKRIPYKTTDPAVIDRQHSILELLIGNKKCTEETFRIFIGEPEVHKVEAARILDEMFCLTSDAAQDEQEEKVFPIFRKNFTPPDVVRIKVPHGKQSRRLWRPIGAGQMQIDAGQKKFGATYCSECNLVYSVHEPEEEKLHWDFHNALIHINFRGWQAENVVLQVPEWGVEGRVICVQTTDSRPKVNRVENLLLLIDAELGAYPRPMPPKAIAYLAIAYHQIMGVCLAEPITAANRLVQRNGVDYFSEETFPAHCGIIKLWTALPFRGQGVARQLIRAVQVHFVFGHVLSYDEIAFSSPTDAGKEFATKLTGRNNFLVYP